MLSRVSLPACFGVGVVKDLGARGEGGEEDSFDSGWDSERSVQTPLLSTPPLAQQSTAPLTQRSTAPPAQQSTAFRGRRSSSCADGDEDVVGGGGDGNGGTGVDSVSLQVLGTERNVGHGANKGEDTNRGPDVLNRGQDDNRGRDRKASGGDEDAVAKRVSLQGPQRQPSAGGQLEAASQLQDMGSMARVRKSGGVTPRRATFADSVQQEIEEEVCACVCLWLTGCG
eukprot:scaffold10984_cov18-Tisochrysis_lutea.AAC.3